MVPWYMVSMSTVVDEPYADELVEESMCTNLAEAKAELEKTRQRHRNKQQEAAERHADELSVVLQERILALEAKDVEFASQMQQRMQAWSKEREELAQTMEAKEKQHEETNH